MAFTFRSALVGSALVLVGLSAAPAAAQLPPAPAPKDAGATEPRDDTAGAATLAEPDVRVRVVAPSALGPWTLRIDNAGAQAARVPADVRLLRFTLENGDTMAKPTGKPVTCAVPAGLRLDAFPDRQALVLGPGDSYVETFDPRLFCFGKDEKALVGGMLVRARYGWDAPRAATKLGPPYAMESIDFPASFVPQKELIAPPLLLSYLPPAVDDGTGEANDTKPREDAKGAKPQDANEPAAVDDKNAPTIALQAPTHAEAATGSRLALTVTATNTGRRSTLVVIRARMVGFRVEGPDGVTQCGTVGSSMAVPREGYQTLRPGGSMAVTVLVEEACGRSLFRRPGLYRVTPMLRLVESGAELGLMAWTGTARAKNPTLVRIVGGTEPFYALRPKSVRDSKAEPEAPAEP